jgi:hypothetical protein
MKIADIWPKPAAPRLNVTFGARLAASLMSVAARASSIAASNAEIETGVSCTFCSRN